MTSIPIHPSLPEISYSFAPYIPNTSMQIRLVSAVTETMKEYFDIPSVPDFKVKFDIRHECPETFKDERLIYITAIDIYWSQFIYQYAHEFCHLLIPEPIPYHRKWFEESICELSSLFFLNRLEERWERFFPDDQGKYLPLIREYISDILKSGFTPFPLESLSIPDSAISLHLAVERYDRKINKYLALQMLPIFESHPDIWRAVPLLCKVSDAQSFKDYLLQWRDISGQDYIDNIISLIQLCN